MIAALHIAGLGPHQDITLQFPDRMGFSEICGASMQGKTTALEAVCFVLWGTGSDGRPFPLEAIADGVDRVSVELDTGKAVFRRVMTRDRTHTRVIVRGDEETPYRTEEDFREALGGKPVPLGRRVAADGSRVDLARILMVPFAWMPLATSNARALRDVLAAVLPPADLRAEVERLMQAAGATLRKGDPMDPKLAEDRRRAVRRDLDAASGALEEARRRVTELSAPIADGATPDEYRTAIRVVNADTAWGQYEAATASVAEQEQGRAAAEGALQRWEADRAALGARPVPDDGAYRKAYTARIAAQREQTRAADADARARAALNTAAFDAQEAAAHLAHLSGAGDRCPTCERDGWAGAAVRIEEARAGLVEAEAKAKAATVAASAAAAALQAATTAATEALDAENAAHRDLEEQSAAARAWDARLSALGPKPAVPAPARMPTAPTDPRPDAASAGRARAIVEEQLRADGARRQRAKDLEAATRALREVEARHGELAIEAKRLDALVDARRRAPTEIARRQADALGDLGPVSLRWNDDGPAVEVFLDGRPWRLASTGRQVVGDLVLRAALRRALGVRWLPLFVDRVQDWSGAWPALDGPAVFLRTTDGAISVGAFGARSAA